MQVRVGILSYHLALESSHQGRSESKILLVGNSAELKHRFCCAPVLTLPYLQQPFEIKTDASDYAIGAVLTQQGHLVAYHSDTLSDTVYKYPTCDNEMYSIVQACRQWNHYIFGKEMIIHIDHRPLQFIQTQGKLHYDHH